MLTKAAQFIKEAKMMIVAAGTGMGKDSGIVEFKGNQAFWEHYPAYKNQYTFIQCANPDFLKTHPQVFWGYYGQRLELYREKQPHEGYKLLREMANMIAGSDGSKDNLFAITSNVDGHFQKAGYPEKRVQEMHGSIHYLQCYDCQVILPNTFKPYVEPTTMTCKNPPLCPECKDPMRPNVLMFGDWEWLHDRNTHQ